MNTYHNRVSTPRLLAPWRPVRSYIGAALRGLIRDELARSRAKTAAEFESRLAQLRSEFNTRLSEIHSERFRILDGQRELKRGMDDLQRDLSARIEFSLNDLSQVTIDRYERLLSVVKQVQETIDNRIAQQKNAKTEISRTEL